MTDTARPDRPSSRPRPGPDRPTTDPDDDATDTGHLDRVPALRPLSPVPTWIGVGVVAVGFALIAIAWGQVAGETDVAQQMPYLISGAATGLALVMVGLTTVTLAARRRDRALRQHQTRMLADALHEVRAASDGRASR